MIDVDQVLEAMPRFQKFCSVQELHALTEELQGDARFEVQLAGTSVGGRPIHHVRHGTGRTKALVVGFPHCMEPIGGMTVYALLTMLRTCQPQLAGADVEWHIVPCADPDGAILNERWSQQPFRLETYIKYRYLQAARDQVDASFPIAHKRMVWDRPSREAAVLRDVLDRVQPDFFFSLHNAQRGGAYFLLSHAIGRTSRNELQNLLSRHGIAIQQDLPWARGFVHFGEGIFELPFRRKRYDLLESHSPTPEKSFPNGAGSWDYLQQIKPEALTFVAEIGYVSHPAEQSTTPTGENLRRFLLRLEADTKFLASVILQEWERVHEELDPATALYKAVAARMESLDRDRLCEGGHLLSRYTSRELLFDPQHNRTMTQADCFNACMVDGGLFFIIGSYQIVRLLEESPPTPVVSQALRTLRQAFDSVLAELARHVDFERFTAYDCDVLARVQLGSGLIALNSLLVRA